MASRTPASRDAERPAPTPALGLDVGHLLLRPGTENNGNLRRDLVVYTHAGQAEYTAAGHRVGLRAMDLLLVPRPAGHYTWRTLGDADWDVTWFFLRLDPFRLEQFAGQPCPNVPLAWSLSGLAEARIAAAFRRLAEAQALPEAAAALLRPALVDVIIAELRLFLGPPATVLDPAVAVARSFLDSRLTEITSLDEVVRVSGLGRTSLVLRFTATLGMPPMRYLEERRLLTASERLKHGGDPVAAIARSLGFGDHRYFATRFRRRFGCTPSAWRERMVGG